MHVSQTTKDANTAVLKITAGEAELEPIRQHTLGHFVRKVKIPGFRAGKAPLNLVEKHVDQQAFLDEFIEHAVNELYNRSLAQEKIRAVAPPQIEIKKFVPFSTLEFEATVLFVKIAKLVDYKRIKAAAPKVEVSAADVENVIKSLRQRAAERTTTDQPAKNGNEVIIDFSGRDDKNKVISGATGQDIPLQLGSQTFIPGFEAELVDLKAGDKKQFSLTFPKDYGVASMRSKKVSFNVTLKTVNILYQTAADDAFAAKVSPFKTLAELKADIKKQLTAERQLQANRELESQIIVQLVDKSDLKVPAALVEEQVLRMEEQEKVNLTGRGQTWQEHLREEEVSEEKHRERHRPDAERQIKAGILLGEVSEAENVQVSSEELAIRTQVLKGQYGDEASQVELDKPEAQRDIRTRMLTEKTLAKLAEYASSK